MSLTATSAPSSANTSAIPRPIPRRAPVISATLFFNFTLIPSAFLPDSTLDDINTVQAQRLRNKPGAPVFPFERARLNALWFRRAAHSHADAVHRAQINPLIRSVVQQVCDPITPARLEDPLHVQRRVLEHNRARVRGVNPPEHA